MCIDHERRNLRVAAVADRCLLPQCPRRKEHYFVDSRLLDAIARRLAKAHSRRLALQIGAAGLIALLGEASLGSNAEGEKKHRNRNQKERRRENRRERKQERRKERRNSCQANETKCGDVCIGADDCCTSDDCTGVKTGQCVSNTCQAAFQTCTNADGSLNFVDAAPGNPPKSKGAVKFKVGPDPAVDDWAHLRNAEFAGVPIADIRTLEFGTYSERLINQACPDFAPYMALYTVAGNNEQILVSSAEVPSPAQCDSWQVIDAAGQKWWMPFDQGFAPQNNPKTLAEIATQFPGMTIRNALTTDNQCPTTLGGLRLEYGEFPGGGGTGNAVAYVSYLTVEIAGSKETYLF